MRIKLYIFIALGMLLTTWLNGQELTTPDFTSLSVDPVTGQVVLKWRTPDASENILSHEISRKPYTSGNYFFENIATVNMPDITYSEAVTDLSTQQHGYRIRSKNEEDTSPISDMHVTMRFSGEYSECTNSINLRWTEYQRFAIDENGQINFQNQQATTFNNTIEYEVWGHHGNSFDISAAEKLSDRNKQNANITLENLEVNTTYFLYVKAFLPNGDIATSYRIDLLTSGKRFPSVMNIDTVASEMGMISLYINLDKSTDIDTFAIYRADTRIPLAWFYSAADVPAKFTDRSASIGQVYHYNLVGFLCGERMLKSDTVSNILLYATPLNLNAEIRWTEFFNQSSTAVYTLHRTSPSKQTVNPGNSLYFLDQSTREYVCFGPKKFCYVMTAQTGKSYARSGESCVSLNSMITMPEAIDPISDISITKNCSCNTDCVNYRRLFGPVMDLNNEAYRLEMEIFDRSGIRLFSSKKDFNIPLQKEYHYWDGKYKGKYVKSGVYVYYTKIEFLEGSPVMMRGSVTVVIQNSN
ncbi:MAG: gliding motility-associated C-terminal domain-containing protein [Prevotellaceae bacterium]|nr:gliding motility-associated C-terminal domain-containing protein [Prevotellaceae bacterium]